MQNVQNAQFQQFMINPIAMYYSITEFKSIDFTNALNNMITKIINIRNGAIESFRIDDSEIFFVTYNLFNAFADSLTNGTKILYEQFKKSSTESQKIIMVCVSLGTLFVGTVICLCLLLIIMRSKQNFLGLFLHVPLHNVKEFAMKCEGFINLLNIREEEDMTQEDDNTMTVTMQIEDVPQEEKKRKRRALREIRINKKLLILFVLGAAISITYFIAVFVLDMNFINKQQIIIDELQIAGEVDQSLNYAYNGFQYMF